MIARIPARIVYALFATAALCATYPVWRLWILGTNLTLDELLQLRCF
jgi:hypothetical protein